MRKLYQKIFALLLMLTAALTAIAQEAFWGSTDQYTGDAGAVGQLALILLLMDNLLNLSQPITENFGVTLILW
jgi:hypothetical protein